MSPLIPHFVRRAVPSALSVGALTTVLASCESTTLTDTAGDRIMPTVSLSVVGVRELATKTDTVNLRVPLDVTVNASDNAGIQSIVTSVVVEPSTLVATEPLTR
jgi:hypothetical protein